MPCNRGEMVIDMQPMLGRVASERLTGPIPGATAFGSMIAARLLVMLQHARAGTTMQPCTFAVIGICGIASLLAKVCWTRSAILLLSCAQNSPVWAARVLIGIGSVLEPNGGSRAALNCALRHFESR